MKILIILLCLTGCGTTQYVPMYIMPKPPPILLIECEPATLLTTGDMQDIASVMIINAGKYKKCKNNNDQWINWYNGQQKIINGEKK